MLLALILAPLVAGCERTGSHWQRVELPGPGRVVALTGTPDGVLVGRYDPAARVRPSLDLLTPDGTTREVRMRTSWKESGREAELVSVSAFDDEVVVLGGARAGAHSNVRWTVWSGSTEQVSEQPQRFETFGGWDAGSLTGTAISRSGPLILGSWANRSRHGLDVAVWQQRGEEWSQPAGAGRALQASGTRQPSPGAVTALPSGYLAVGWVTVLEPKIRDVAVLWTATEPAGPWRTMTFPRTDEGIERPTAVACSKDHCAVAGRSGDDVVVWQVPLEDGAPTVVTPPRTVATGALHTQSPTIAVAATADVDVVAFSEGESTRVVDLGGEDDDSATDLPGHLAAMTTQPDASVLLATTRDGTTQAWRHPL